MDDRKAAQRAGVPGRALERAGAPFTPLSRRIAARRLRLQGRSVTNGRITARQRPGRNGEGRGALTPLRLAKIAGSVLILAVAIWTLARIVRIDALFEHYGAITDYVRAHFGPAIALYIAIYIVVVVFSIPVALALSLIGGALFGGLAAGLAIVFAATLGAVLVFLAARGLFHAYFVRKTEAWLGGIRQEFHADAASYLLILRLTPIFPFAAVNLAAALLGARLGTYFWTTLVGIVPGTLAYSFVGAGLNGVLESEARRLAECRARGASPCVASFDPSAFVSRDIALALGGLAVLVLLSMLARRHRSRSVAPSADSRQP